jgi:hypothetical protein
MNILQPLVVYCGTSPVIEDRILSIHFHGWIVSGNEGLSIIYPYMKDNLNQGGTTKALRLSSLQWEEWRFFIAFVCITLMEE